MNHIYKSIFNKALGVFTAVPEFASAHGKGSERTVVGRVAKGTAGFAASALAISVGLALTSTSAVAGPGIYINDGTDASCFAIPDAQNPNVGIHGISGGTGTVSPVLSILGPSQVVPGNNYYALDVMKPCLSSTGANAAEHLSTQTNRTLFYGNNSYGNGTLTNNGAKNLTLGGRLDVNSGIIGVGDRGVNGGSGATNSIRMGTGTTLADANKVVNGIAIGVNTQATQNLATAIGANAVASGNSASQALGYDAVASGKSAIAHGFHSHADGQSSIAIGDNAKASGIATVSIGFEANGHSADGDKDNTPSSTKATYGTAVGHFAGADYTGTDNERSTAVGNQAGRYGEGGTRNTAVGERSGMYVKGSQNVAMGVEAGSGTATNKLEANNTVAIGTSAKASASNTIAMGNTAQAKTTHSIAIGQNASAGDDSANTEQKGVSAVAIGHGAQANYYDAIAIGARATVAPAAGNTSAADSIAIGVEATADNYKTTAIGTYARAKGRQSTVIANNVQGSNYSTASGDRSQVYGVETTVSGNNSVAIGDTNNIESARTYAMGNNINAAAGTQDSLVFGTRATVEAVANIAMGKTATTHTDSSIAIGNGAESGGKGANDGFNGTNAVAIGPGAKGLGTGAVAIGSNASVKDGHDSIAMGVYSQTTNNKAISIGAYNEASGVQSTVIGSNFNTKNDAGVSVASGTRAQVYGVATTVSGNNSVAIGDTNTVTSDRTYAMGNNITTGAGAHDSLAFGTQTYVGNASAIAMGNAAKAVGKEQVSIGKNAGADSANSEGNYYGVYIGSEAGRYQQGAGRNYAIGQNAGQYVKGSSNIALGTDAGKGDAGNVIDASSTIAIGRETKAAGYSGIAIGTQAEATHANGIALGDNASATNGHDSLAVGAFSKTTAAKAMSIGSYSTASGAQSIVIANNYADASGASNRSTATAARAIVMGPESHATAEDALAIGNKNTVASARTYAIGNNINVAAGADDSLVFGTKAAVGAANTVAIGANANAAQANSVALGAGSATSAPHTGDYTLNGSYTAAGLPVAANGTVSVGSAGKERQIQNVAAGVISATSTDAINGSQLYATNNYLSNFATGVKNVLGGDAAVNNAGNLTMSNIGGTGKGNVNDAIAAANTKVAAGENITVTPTTNTDGSKTYTVATKKDLVVDSVKAGDTTVNTDGVTITGGPSVKKDGINAGDKKITGVADGNVAAGSTDAVNGGQLAEVKAKADSAVQEVESENPTALSVKKDGTKVTLTPNFIAGDLVNADGTVNDPATDDEGKLVSAKTVADALKANHFVVDTKANGGTVDASVSEENAKVGSGNKVTFEAGKNLVAQQTNTANGGATVNYKLSDTLENLVSVKSAEIEAGIGPNKVVLNNNGVKVGDSTLNDKGLTINNGPSVTDAGINAGDKKITDVADGNVAPGSKDAVNGGQLAAVKAKADSAVQDVKSGDENALTAVKDPNTNIVTVTPKLSGDLVDANGNITAPTTPADKGKLVTAGTVADALANTHFVVDTKATDGELDAASQADQKIKAGNKVTLQAGKNLKAKQTNGANGAQVEFSLKDSISLTEVTAGTGDNQVVLGNNGVQVGGNTYINKDGLNANSKVISNVADGVNPNDAVNKGQLDAVKGVADSAVKSVDVANGEQNLVVDNTDPKNPKLSLKKDLTVDSVKAGDSTLNDNGLTIAGGPSVTKGGINAGGNTITNVADGVNDTDAVNKGQLNKVDTKVSNVAQNVVNVLGGDAAVNGNGDITMSNIGETGKGNINDAIKSVNDLAKKAAAEKTSVKAKEGRSNVTVTEGINAAGGHEYTVDVERSVTNAGSDYVTVTNNHDADSNTTTYTVDVSAKTKASLAKADSAVQGLTSKDGNLNFTKGANGNVEVSFNDNLNVKNVTTDRVQVANGPSMSKDGINAAGKAISNVANGNVAKGSKDAVNGGQLHETAQSVADVIGGGATVKDGKVVAGQNGIGNTGQNTVHGAIAAINQNTANNFNQIRGDLRKMDRDLRGGIAGALATAGLPQAFRPGKSMVAAAASTYRGQSGLAIGVSRISDNGKVILKVTGNTNSRGDFGGTIGAGYQW